MGLRQRLAMEAVRGTSVLLVEAPGSWQVRANVERAVLQRGWCLALSPADADALVVCGWPGAGLAAAVEAVWQQLPGPRARANVVDADVVGALDRVEAGLLDEDGQRADARGRQREPVAPPDANGEVSGGGHHAGDGDAGGDGPNDGGDVDMEMDDDSDAGGDGGMGTGMGMGMDMGMDMAPDDIDLAGGFDEDRDGLEMDVLNVGLGPVLPAWPAGVVLRATLSGDVVVDAEIEVLDGVFPVVGVAAGVAWAGSSEPVATAARGCDRAAALLGLAGADDLAAGLRCVRDDLLAGTPPERVRPGLERLTRSVSRSRLLRWSLRGLGRLDPAALARHGLPGSCGGDVHDRLVAILDGAVDVLGRLGDSSSHAVDGRGREDGDDPDVAARVREAVPALVVGYELAAVRLVVASLPVEPVTDRATAGVR